MQRNFGLVSLVAFSTTLLASWEAIAWYGLDVLHFQRAHQVLASTFQSGLVNGGPAVLIYGLALSWLGSLAVCASLAEMASMRVTPILYAHVTLLADQIKGSDLRCAVSLGRPTRPCEICRDLQLGGWYTSRPQLTFKLC